MALSPTTTFLNAHIEQPNEVTKHLKYFPNSFEAVELDDNAAADYTKTVAAVAVGEYRPFSVVTLALASGGTLNATNVITISKANRQTGDVVRIVWSAALVTSGKTITIKDDASTPATLSTIDEDDDVTYRTRTNREYILTSAGTWIEIGTSPVATA